MKWQHEGAPWAQQSDDQQRIPLSESWVRSKPEKVPETNVASPDNPAPQALSEWLLPSPRNHMGSKTAQENNKDRSVRTYSESYHP